MTRDDALLCWLYATNGITLTRAKKLLKHYGSADALWHNLDASAIKITGEKVYAELTARRTTRHIDQITGPVDKWGMHIVKKGDANYPLMLAHIPDAPHILYVRGEIRLTDMQIFAVIGARRCTRELVQSGVTVVSGMARGIDTAAHMGALEAKGRTIAVLGCGLDIAYPPENASLIERVIDMGGSIVSEYAPGTPPHATNFPQRNRIISGMSAGILVVEAAKGSGAMITTQIALDQGREVYALPGNVDAPLSQLPLQLISEGAHMARGAEDIVSSFSWITPSEQLSFLLDAAQVGELPALSDDERAVIRAVENEPLSFDEILNITKFEANLLNSLLTILEIKEIMKQLPGRMYALA